MLALAHAAFLTALVVDHTVQSCRRLRIQSYLVDNDTAGIIKRNKKSKARNRKEREERMDGWK